MKFDKFSISSEIKENLEQIGFFRTTDIQFKTIPAILNGEDVLAIAQTGTGKTAAFAIPVINQIHVQKTSKRSYGIKCLVLVPTRELAKQIGQVFAKLSRHTKASTYAIYGGVEQDPQIEQLAGGIDVLIATPGRMFDLISQKHMDISRVQTLVLDEADRMLDMGFIEDIESIKRKLTQHHQTLFFSATINPTIKKLAYSQVRSSALRIQVSPEKLVSKNITHQVAKVAMDDKRHLLLNFFKANPETKAIVFVRTQVRAERVLAHLTKNGVEAICIHGGMPQEERETNLETFRQKPESILIATDVSARGIDVSGITHVINYDIPDDPENYVHRIGRTGRGFAKGDAISFCSPEEKEKLAQIEELIQTKIGEVKVDKNFMKEAPSKNLENMDISEMLDLEEAKFESPRSPAAKKKKKHYPR
jgi:ATP-dependent RNA helicase RhlE